MLKKLKIKETSRFFLSSRNIWDYVFNKIPQNPKAKITPLRTPYPDIRPDCLGSCWPLACTCSHGRQRGWGLWNGISPVGNLRRRGSQPHHHVHNGEQVECLGYRRSICVWSCQRGSFDPGRFMTNALGAWAYCFFSIISGLHFQWPSCNWAAWRFFRLIVILWIW